MRDPSPIQKIVADSLKALIEQNARIIKILEELTNTGETRVFVEPAATSQLPITPAAKVEVVQSLVAEGYLTTGIGQAMADSIPERKRRRSSEPGKSIATWTSYSEAYISRYGAAPVRNAMASKLCCVLVDHLGAIDAPQVAAFYVRHNDMFYTKAGHSLQLLVRDAQKLHTEWKTGRKITTAQAKQTERRSHNQDTVKQYLEKESTVEYEPEYSNAQAEIPEPPCSVG